MNVWLGKYNVGIIRAYELFPKPLVSRYAADTNSAFPTTITCMTHDTTHTTHTTHDTRHDRLKEERKKKFDEVQRTELARVKAQIDATTDGKAKKGAPP
jgi:hypothetical protein